MSAMKSFTEGQIMEYIVHTITLNLIEESTSQHTYIFVDRYLEMSSASRFKMASVSV